MVPGTISELRATVAEVPASCQPAPVTVPCAESAVNIYWVFQSAIAVLGPFIIIAFEGEFVPEASPLQPVKTYWVPMGTLLF